jgi:osomolarity two-component system sensor histidine kinase SLN1
MLRIPIREQLASLVLLTTLTGLAVIAIATWILDYNRIKTLGVYYLGLTASLKAAQLSSNLDLMERSVRSLSTRVRVQTALTMYNNGTNATATWNQFASDLGAALAAPGSDVLTLQVAVFALNGTVPGIGGSLLNVTGNTINVTLPNGGQLGDAVGGYPANLYPNLTFGPTPGQTGQGNSGFYNGQVLGADAAIFLGPWSTNATFALSSITLPVISTTTLAILGFMTIVLDSRLIFDVLNSPVGLGSTGVSLLVGPFTVNNEFDGFPYQLSLPIQSNASTIIDSPVRFVLPPNETYSSKRHNLRAYGQPGAGNSFNMADYPLVRRAATIDDGEINNAGGTISTQNEQGITVSAGYAIPSSKLVDWILILEESKAEVYAPIDKLRKVLLGCVFGTALGIILLVIPLAHYSSRPIRRLRDATAKSIIRLGSHPSSMVEKDPGAQHVSSPASQRSSRQETTGKWPSIFVKSFRRSTIQEQKYPRPSTLKHSYPIPDAVQARRTWVQDELSDLTYYFNEMSDELVLFYGKLEERVRSRTAELEMAKKAAEAANESKTLFIANISHELKTPLNGILGMCAVCMQEDDPVKIKRSLGIIYKSGDLLHNLLTDLLTFSKNQTGQIQLVQSEFPLRDIGIQVKAIFENQAREGQVNFSIAYEGCRDSLGSTIDEVKKDYGPPGTGRVKDMHLFGDMQRVLQVVINLVSNCKYNLADLLSPSYR